MQSSNGRRWVILRHVVLLPGFILQQFRRIHLRKKNLLTVRINRRVRLHILSVTSFTSGMWIWIFFRAIFVHQCKRYPLLLSGPKGNNDFSHCSFIKNLPPPLCPLSHTGIKFMYIPLALTKAWTTRDAFLQFFFYYY